MTDQVKNTCKIGQGADCCRYLIMGTQGFECAKNTTLAKTLDMRVLTDTITAQGDNCEGKTIKELNDK